MNIYKKLDVTDETGRIDFSFGLREETNYFFSFNFYERVENNSLVWKYVENKQEFLKTLKDYPYLLPIYKMRHFTTEGKPQKGIQRVFSELVKLRNKKITYCFSDFFNVSSSVFEKILFCKTIEELEKILKEEGVFSKWEEDNKVVLDMLLEITKTSK
ncbi:MAG: hypothetical protein ACRC0V_08470 [Fusobacteriaceae bacterium]